jgi:transposase
MRHSLLSVLSVSCMFQNHNKSRSILHAASQASKRSETPATQRPTVDRLCSDANPDIVTERDRRRPCRTNPNSRLNVPILRSSSNPQGREAAMHNESSIVSPSVSQSVAGIDVSKSTLDCFIDLPAASFTVGNDDAGRAQLVARLKSAGVALVCIEATGRYHRQVAADLVDVGIAVALVNPQRAREFARSIGKLEKSDRIDARTLAGFARAAKHRTLEKQRENQTELSDLVSRRRALVQMRIAEKNRLGDHPPKLARRQGEKLLRLIEQQIEDLDRAIARLIESDDDWNNKAQIIDSVPGIGPSTAHQLVAGLPELGQLGRTRIAKLVGVAPLLCDSGKMRGKRTIGGGRESVRSVLYMGAFNAMQHNARFIQYAQRLFAAGKEFKVVVTACMRKLLVMLNQMIKTNSHWNEKLAFNH